ncbi:EAL domain-containing protein, partial [Methylobacterium radiotolerans]
MARAVGILRRLKSYGIRISMDDFGTGYASLATLQAFPFDKLKIDRSFVAQLGTGPQAAVIVRAVLSLGRSLGMGVVPQGAGTPAQLTFLTEERQEGRRVGEECPEPSAQTCSHQPTQPHRGKSAA